MSNRGLEARIAALEAARGSPQVVVDPQAFVFYARNAGNIDQYVV